MDEKRIVTATGFLKVLVTLDEETKKLNLAFTRTAIYIDEAKAQNFQVVAVRIGADQFIALKEGVYRVKAVIGEIDSEWTNTEIKNGEVTSRIFHFGKEPPK